MSNVKQHILSNFEKLKRLTYKNNSPLFFLIFPQIITFIIFYIIFSHNNIYPFGNKSIAWCDLRQQGIPLLMNLRDVLSGEGSILYSFNNASGMNFWGVFLFFLSNPFSFLCILFEKSDIYKFVNILVVLKLCFASFTATLFFLNHNKKLNRFIASALGVSYALCAYGLMYYQNLMWLDLMYLYPLLALGIIRVLANKGYGFYTLILTLCVLFNFYLSYMIVVALLLVIGLYMLMSKTDSIHKGMIATKFFKGSAIAALTSAVSWLPAFIQYSQSGRGENLIETLADSKWGASKNTTFLLLLSSTVIVIGFLSLYKPNRKKVGTFICFVLFALPVFVEPINKMWHTGSYMAFPCRYAYITIFTGLELVALALEKDEASEFPSTFFDKLSDRTKKTVHITTAILCGVTILLLVKFLVGDYYRENVESFFPFTKTLWADKKQFTLTLIAAIIFASIYLISTLLYKFKAIHKTVFTIFLTLMIVCEGCFAINVYAVTITERRIFTGYNEFLDLEDRINDDSFFRIKTEAKYQDSNLLGALGYNSIGHYTSLSDLDYMNTYKSLGYSSHWMELSTYGGTELSDAILGVKYEVLQKYLTDSVYTNGTYSIVETFGALGLGVKYSGDNDVLSPYDYERTDFQEKIFASLFESDEKLFEKYQPTSLNNCTILKKERKTFIDGKGEIYYEINVTEEQSLYFDAFGEFSNNVRQAINNGFTIYVNDKKIATYPDGMYTGFVSLGKFKNETVNIKVVVNEESTTLLSYGVSGLKLDVLKTAMENKESGYLNAEDNKVWGTVNAKSGEKLFIAVPYNEGFKITLNGKEISGEKVFGDFYSIDLEDGENVIEMKFTPPGFFGGILISLLGLVLALILRLIAKKRKLIYGETIEMYKADFNSVTASNIKHSSYRTFFIYAFIALSGIVFLAIYLLPILIKLFC